MLEHEVEAHLRARCRQMGFLCMKFTSPGRAGVPDRVVVTPAGTVFVETKRPGGKLRRLQEEVTEKMRRAGAEVHVVDTVAGVDELVERLAERRAAA
ncbi:VRR-NUC domain-containing protein [Enemella evansiae]|nr:VRR-NUC domain-containing protein [Enemella evansiae]TDO89546.1 VRR-NUC domain-containing protein [Enemella evansiae]